VTELDDAALAADLARTAAELAARMRADGLSIARKSSVSDVVTDADHAAERLIVEGLAGNRPDDGIVGEEGTAVASRSGRTWLLDPVDGTYNFAAGLPFWCTALALVSDDRPLIGAVAIPASGELWVGGEDRPTTCNGAPVAPLADRPLSAVSVCSYLHPDTIGNDDVREPLLELIRPAATVRMLGSGSVELAAIAAGRMGAYAQYDCRDWDWYPGRALIEGAGGATAVVAHRGHRWHLAGNRQTVAELAARLG
jgi:fructose-1,6-bisphosphatase/inositol monophosphatase family enzyme